MEHSESNLHDLYTQKRFEDSFNNDHSVALSSVKVAKRLVKKTVKLVESGKTERGIYSPALKSHRANADITTLALQAELNENNIPITAVVNRYPMTDFDSETFSIIVTEINGIPVGSHQIPQAREQQ